MNNANMVEHKGRKGERYWTDDEHRRFLQAVRIHGKNWAEITKFVGSRSRQSVYSHAQKFRKRVEKEPNLEGADCARILSGGENEHVQAPSERTNTCAIEDIFPIAAAESTPPR